MSKSPYRVLFHANEHDIYDYWQFDDTEFESAEDAFDFADKNYGLQSFRIIKLCYPKD